MLRSEYIEVIPKKNPPAPNHRVLLKCKGELGTSVMILDRKHVIQLIGALCKCLANAQTTMIEP